METISKFTLPGTLFLLTLASGIWLSRLGKPYQSILFNVHKLIALGTVIFTIIVLSNLLKGTQVHALIPILWIIAGLSVIALFATGALMSLEKLNYNLMKTIHAVAPALIVIALGTVIYLLNRKTP